MEETIVVRAIWNGQVIAESDDTIVVEGNHYFPDDSVRNEFLEPSDRRTNCPWKGQASYRSVVVDGKVNLDAAWLYPTPLAAAGHIQGRVAFWRGVTIEDTERAPRRTLRDLLRPAKSSPRVADSGHVSPVVDLDTAGFAASTTGHATIIDFWASWCAPCKAFHPSFEGAAVEHACDELWFARVNIDTNPNLAAKLNIMSIPTVVVFDTHGNEVDRQTGVPDRRRLDQLISHAHPAPRGAA